jgi:hypothetical protein
MRTTKKSEKKKRKKKQAAMKDYRTRLTFKHPQKKKRNE